MTAVFELHCVNNTCDAKKLPKLNPIPPLRPHLSSSVSKACNSKSKQTENSCKRSATASASSVMQSACASCKLQTRFDTLIYSAFPCAALRTLWENTLQKFRKSFAHQKTIGVQHKRTRLNSVSVPCLQIRVGRFDSGPRLHRTLQTVPHSLLFVFANAPRTLATQKLHSTAPAQRIKLGAALSEFLAQHNCE
jgi:hypothetical protein